MIINKYFKAFHENNLEGMAAVLAPSITILDYGQSFKLDEWNWYTNWSFKEMVPYDVKLSNFKTRIEGETAYTFFHMRGGEPDILEVASAVLKRIDGQWRIDYLSIEKCRAGLFH